MATLKEIKGRIASVGSTLKTTSAMKMVASAKFHRAQGRSVALVKYEQSLSSMLASLLTAGTPLPKNPFTLSRTTKSKAVVVALSSDASLCGGFNTQAINAMKDQVARLHDEGYERVEVVPVGGKMAQAVRKSEYAVRDEFADLFGSLDYAKASRLADTLMAEYASGQTDCVYVVYNHFHSMGRQVSQRKQLLPFDFQASERAEGTVDYIFEPGAGELLNTMIPYTIRMEMYSMLLDSATSEQAARTVAMQTASDNAQKLLAELRLDYNKRRQQAITNELADITQSE